jgi:hypothetical protein
LQERITSIQIFYGTILFSHQQINDDSSAS